MAKKVRAEGLDVAVTGQALCIEYDRNVAYMTVVEYVQESICQGCCSL